MDIRKDPTGKPACSARRTVMWATVIASIATNILSVSLDAGGAASVAAVWASAAVAVFGIIAYAVSRATLDKLVVQAMSVAGDIAKKV